MPRYTIRDLKQFANTKNGDCLSEKYFTNETKYIWRCEKGHVFEMIWLTIKVRGGWCQSCRTGNDIEALHEYAREKGGKCLTENYTRCNDKFLFECENGHMFESQWSDMKSRDSWCKQCNSVSIEDLQKRAEERGGKCLSTEYKTTDDKYIWQCEKRHIWEATWVNVGYERATWCRQCLSLTKDKIDMFVKQKGGKCNRLVSNLNGVKRYEFECSKGHKWETSASIVINNGTWCLSTCRPHSNV